MLAKQRFWTLNVDKEGIHMDKEGIQEVKDGAHYCCANLWEELDEAAKIEELTQEGDRHLRGVDGGVPPTSLTTAEAGQETSERLREQC